MSAQDDEDSGEVARFAARLRALKERTDRSYGSLARRLGMNTSTLHRYCAGEAVPLDFAPVERFAALCGATPEQRLELHRCWLLAVAARHRPRTAQTADAAAAVEEAATGAAGTAVGGGATQGDGGAGPAPGAGAGAGADGSGADGGGTSAAPDPAPAGPAVSPTRRTWYRRRRAVAALAGACAVLATLGALTALPDGHRAPAGTPARAAAGPSAPATAGIGASERPSTSSSPARRTPSASHSAQPPAPGKKPPAATVPSGAASATAGGGQSARLPLAWSVNSQAWKLGCGHDYVIAKEPARVPPPPAPQDAAPWAATQGAVHGGETLVQLTVQGRSNTAVVLEALRVRVSARTAPAEGSAYAMDQGCGGAVTPRFFAVDLDKDRPLARAVAGNDSGTPIPAVRMPYRVSATDPEVLLVTAGTRACDCRWYLELDWSSQGRTGTVRIDDDGRPFRTSAIEGLPRYTYDTLERRWGPYS
ncbi:helix-turn-helix domain-containing protein [Streptomyces olivaceus]|uniref:helix-turn-helix domain-containing protein n=1 Tax=Streptomyces olivaceus TaxID=47716 RepID=UPI00340DE551